MLHLARGRGKKSYTRRRGFTARTFVHVYVYIYKPPREFIRKTLTAFSGDYTSLYIPTLSFFIIARTKRRRGKTSWRWLAKNSYTFVYYKYIHTYTSAAIRQSARIYISTAPERAREYNDGSARRLRCVCALLILYAQVLHSSCERVRLLKSAGICLSDCFVNADIYGYALGFLEFECFFR